MSLFEKKITPKELRIKLASMIERMRERESHIKNKANKAKIEAKEALKNGNERDFRLLSKRFGRLNGQLITLSGMIELSQSTLDLLRDQKDFIELIDFGTMLKQCHDGMGIDTEQITKTISNISITNKRINEQSALFTSASEVMSPSQGDTEAMALIKAEFNADIEAEALKHKQKGGKTKEKPKKSREKVKST